MEIMDSKVVPKAPTYQISLELTERELRYLISEQRNYNMPSQHKRLGEFITNQFI